MTVVQPGKPTELATLLEGIDTGDVSESTGDSTSEDWSTSGAAVATTGQQAAQGASPRDQAIKSLPGANIMQRQITKHITKEVKQLRRDARKLIRLGRPGEAYKLAQIYARIRQLNGLISQLWEASYEVIRRMFIRIFIDKQPVI